MTSLEYIGNYTSVIGQYSVFIREKKLDETQIDVFRVIDEVVLFFIEPSKRLIRKSICRNFSWYANTRQKLQGDNSRMFLKLFINKINH